MFKIALIGCGRIAELKHIPILQGLPEVALVALAESDAARAARAQAKVPTATCYSDYRQLLAEADVDGVVVCLPTPLHAEAAIATLEAKKHLYLEKPIATTTQDADAILAAWQAAGTTAMTGFSFRFAKEYQTLRRHIQAGAIGPLVGVRTLFTTAHRPLPDWKKQRVSGGGVLLDLASHHIDLLRYLLDEEIAAVSATVSSQRSEDDNATLVLTMHSGLQVQSLFSMSSTEEHRFELYGESGKLVLDRMYEPDVLLFQGTQELPVQRLRRLLDPRRLRYRPNYDQPFRTALATFAKAAASGAQATPDLYDGYRSLTVIEAAERAAQSGKREMLSETR